MRFGLEQLLWAAVAGGGVGFVAGMFGLGGGFLLVPVLRILIHIPIEHAVGAGACQVLGPATTSLLARGVRREQLRLPLTLAGGLFVGVWLGAGTLEWAQQREQRATLESGTDAIPLTDLLVLVCYFVLLLGVGLFALWEVHRWRRDRPLPRGWLQSLRLPPMARFPETEAAPLSIPILGWFGLVVGLLAGLLGMSGGMVLLPGLIYLLGIRTHQAVTSSLVIVWIAAAGATAVHAWHENIDIPLVLALLCGGTIGARIGSEVSLKLVGWKLRQYYGWLLLGTAVFVAVRLVPLVASLSH